MHAIALLSLACLGSSEGEPPPAGPTPTEAWKTIAQGSTVTVAVERALYERSAAPRFFVRVRITNSGRTEVGADLRTYFEVFRPSQWSASPIEHREAIDERRMILPTFDATASAAVIADFRSGALAKIRAGGALDYYDEFNASTRADVDSQARSMAWVIVTMDGQLKISDGTSAERLVPIEPAREVPVRAPVAWKEIPAGANVILD